MLLKKNLLETLTLISCSGSFVWMLLNLVTNISPLKGVWLLIYASAVFCVSLSLSFRSIHWLLRLNKPLKYDHQQLVKDKPYLSVLNDVFPKPRVIDWECKEYDTNELSVITTVLERKLVSSWYVPFVSQEIGFPFACKQLLDQIVGKGFQISNKIETKEVYIDTCMIFTLHLKEYKKAQKRLEKSPQSSIESLYKKSHFTTETNLKLTSTEHYTDLLRVILKELVPWELWETPYSELLVRILAQRLDNFIDSTLADPVWLNDKLIIFLKGKYEPKNDLKQDAEKISEKTEQSQKETKLETTEESIELRETVPKKTESPKSENLITDPLNSEQQKTPTIESALSTVITKTTAPILQIPINGDIKSKTTFHLNGETHAEDIQETTGQASERPVNGTEPVEIRSSPVLRQRRGRQRGNEVKIYDRVLEGSVKTWETAVDLQCVSLGTDLLAGLNGEITLSRLWGADDADARGDGDQNMWFGEEDALDMELGSKETSPVKKESKDTSPRPGTSPKASVVLLKDLQTTVHQAKTKIGDLQVPGNGLDVNHDEAAGMMEGLLDFGIAGFKKGLRFTGLGDDSMEQLLKERSAEKTSPSVDTIKQDNNETSSVVHREENGTSTVPPLLKQQRVASQDSVSLATRPRPPPLPPLADSPEPEYEEAEDLSTSIAKLRCLLEQRERTEHNKAGAAGVWWEGAEETLGRTQRHRSTRPVDSATLADEYDPIAERSASPTQSSNNMQRLDKFLNRAVTGVFNSIMTAVGAEAEAGGGAPQPPGPKRQWTYLTTDTDHSVGCAVARLVGSRRAYSHVEAALDSLDQLPPPPTNEVAPEDFEEWCVCGGGLWCACAELANAAGLVTSHVAYRAAAALTADVSECMIAAYLADLTSHLRQEVFALFERMNEEDSQSERDSETASVPRTFDVDETCEAILEVLPAPLHMFGSDTLSSALHLVLSSLGHKDLNKDLVARFLDVVALHFKRAAGARNPSFDAN